MLDEDNNQNEDRDNTHYDFLYSLSRIVPPYYCVLMERLGHVPVLIVNRSFQRIPSGCFLGWEFDPYMCEGLNSASAMTCGNK